jgi:uncharacterized membrane protein YqjE
MAEPGENPRPLAEASKRVAQRFFVILENRLQLFMLEAQEERDRILFAIWLALGLMAFGLLAGISLTVLIAVALWNHSPVIALTVLTVLYGLAAYFCYTRLMRLQREWRSLPATLDQLQKDRECLEKEIN